MRVITMEFFKRYDSCYHMGADSFVAEGSCLGVSDFSKGPRSLTDVLAYRHKPPHKVICVGVFILGAQLRGVEFCGPQDLQDSI